MTRSKTKAMVIASLIAAFYTALTLALAPISYGPVQMRLSEALTILPAYSPTGIVGVTLGCAVANLVGFLTGANILGALDSLFGTNSCLIKVHFKWEKPPWVTPLGPPVEARVPSSGLLNEQDLGDAVSKPLPKGAWHPLETLDKRSRPSGARIKSLQAADSICCL